MGCARRTHATSALPTEHKRDAHAKGPVHLRATHTSTMRPPRLPQAGLVLLLVLAAHHAPALASRLHLHTPKVKTVQGECRRGAPPPPARLPPRCPPPLAPPPPPAAGQALLLTQDIKGEPSKRCGGPAGEGAQLQGRRRFPPSALRRSSSPRLQAAAALRPRAAGGSS